VVVPMTKQTGSARKPHKHVFVYQFTMHPFTKEAYSIDLCEKCGKRRDRKVGA
jgi:hypothetical protein